VDHRQTPETELYGRARPVRSAHQKRLSVCPGRALPQESRKVDIRLPGNRNSDSHGLRPVNQIISMITWIRTSRFSIKNSPSCHRRGCPKIRQQSRSTVGGERPAIRAGRGSCRSAADPSPGSTLFAEEDSVRPPKENLVRIPNENSVRTPKANSVRPPKENPARLSKTEFSQSFKREFDQADPSLGSTLFPTNKKTERLLQSTGGILAWWQRR